MRFDHWADCSDAEILEYFERAPDALENATVLAAILTHGHNDDRKAVVLFRDARGVWIVEGSYYPEFASGMPGEWAPAPVDFAELGRRAVAEIPRHPKRYDFDDLNAELYFWRYIHENIVGWGGPPPPPVDEEGILLLAVETARREEAARIERERPRTVEERLIALERAVFRWR